MKKRIINYKRVKPEILQLLLEKYPDGYRNKDLIVFKNLKNDIVEALEVCLNGTTYLVRVGAELEEVLQKYAKKLKKEKLLVE
ncbi:hypothetical protein [Aureivirga marina]|uniref:hypothetical protein n=1 Tax=Aureivirga marina TaxID=1182451 RepID=UPI0018C977E2|nr:hypothetical protein [Aureivirga marina]